MDLRCPNKLHARVVDPAPAVVEFKCGSKFCGAVPGVVVLHKFNCATGRLVETKRYKDTPRVTRRESNALGHRTSVRSA